MTQKALAEVAGVSRSTVSTMCRGESVTLKTAQAVADVLERDVKDLFTIQRGDSKLSPKSIQHYVSFVSGVLDYAFLAGVPASHNPSICFRSSKERKA